MTADGGRLGPAALESYLAISRQVEDALLSLLWRNCLLHRHENVRGRALCDLERLDVTHMSVHRGRCGSPTTSFVLSET